MKNVAIILAALAAGALLLSHLAHTSPGDPVTVWWAKTHLVNKERLATIPQWAIVQDGKAKHVNWTNHASNPRFAVYDSGTSGDYKDDLVLDKATGLVWTRKTSLGGRTMTWKEAANYCRSLAVGNVRGFRLPAIEEMYTLFQVGGFVTGTEDLWEDVPSVDGWWTIHRSDPAQGINPGTSISVDEDEAIVAPLGSWTYSSDVSGAYNGDQAVIDPGQGNNAISWALPTTPGTYKVYAWWAAGGPSAAQDAEYTVYYDDGASDTIIVNQQTSSNMWHLLGVYPFYAMDDVPYFGVKLTDNASGQVIADAVAFECTDCPPARPMAVYKGPTLDSSEGVAPVMATKHVWAVRYGRGPAEYYP